VGIGLSDKWENVIASYILRPGGSFVDAGAHVGRWTIRASPFYRRVLSFEPDSFTNKVLRRNLARNNVQNVQVFEIALSNRVGGAPLYRFGPHACSSLRDVHVSGQNPKPGRNVRVKPLDDFTNYFFAPMVLKIDVEGEELAVLRGGSATLEKFHPTVIVEVHFHTERTKIVEEIEARGYEVTEEFSDQSDPEGITFLVAKHRMQ
jgi:FkbM family methyltransferase